MAEQQYLRLVLDKQTFLLPSEASISIEQREHLRAAGAGGAIAAYRETAGAPWPAYSIDGDLRVTTPGVWQRAIFIDAKPVPVGIIAAEIQLLPRSTDMRIEPFTPPGPAPAPAGHVFAGAWVRDDNIVFVFDPKGLAAYLARLGH